MYIITVWAKIFIKIPYVIFFIAKELSYVWIIYELKFQ
jgi:hypothetical protein